MTLHPEVKKFIQTIARKGGLSRSRAKQEASRLNGLKGGRPKGSKNKVKHEI